MENIQRLDNSGSRPAQDAQREGNNVQKIEITFNGGHSAAIVSELQMQHRIEVRAAHGVNIHLVMQHMLHERDLYPTIRMDGNKNLVVLRSTEMTEADMLYEVEMHLTSGNGRVTDRGHV